MVKLLSRRMIRRIRSLRNVRNRLIHHERTRQSDDEDEIIDLTQFPELFDNDDDDRGRERDRDGSDDDRDAADLLPQPVHTQSAAAILDRS